MIQKFLMNRWSMEFSLNRTGWNCPQRARMFEPSKILIDNRRVPQRVEGNSILYAPILGENTLLDNMRSVFYLSSLDSHLKTRKKKTHVAEIRSQWNRSRPSARG